MTTYCKDCGSEIDYRARSDKKFCNSTCRKRYSRLGKQGKSSSRMVMSELQVIRRAIKKRGNVDGLNDDLKRIQDEITDILRLSDKETINEQAQKAELLGSYKGRTHFHERNYKRDVDLRHTYSGE